MLTIAQFVAKQICTVMLSAVHKVALIIQFLAYNGTRKLSIYYIFICINTFIFESRNVFRLLWSVRWNKLRVKVTVIWLTLSQTGAATLRIHTPPLHAIKYEPSKNTLTCRIKVKHLISEADNCSDPISVKLWMLWREREIFLLANYIHFDLIILNNYKRNPWEV